MIQMDKKRIIEFRGRAQGIRATIQVGKEGLTPAVIDEVVRQLKKNKLVKVKLLPSFEEDRRDSGDALARLSSSVLVEVRGRTVVLAKD